MVVTFLRATALLALSAGCSPDPGTSDSGGDVWTPDAISAAYANCSASIVGVDDGEVVFHEQMTWDEYGDNITDDWQYPDAPFLDAIGTLTYGRPHQVASAVYDFLDPGEADWTETFTWSGGDLVEKAVDYGYGPTRWTYIYEAHHVVHEERDDDDDGSANLTLDYDWAETADGWNVEGTGSEDGVSLSTEEFWTLDLHRLSIRRVSADGVVYTKDVEEFSEVGLEGSVQEREWYGEVVTLIHDVDIIFDELGRYETRSSTMSMYQEDGTPWFEDDTPEVATYGYNCP